MRYKISISILMFIFAFCGVNCLAQGKVTRPTQQQSHSSKPKKSTLKGTVSEPDGYIKGHGYVDLGLPSGLKWATCNVGANNPDDYGSHFAWGETSPKSRYDWDTCFDCLDDSGGSWGVYKLGGKTQITPTSGHDTARENWGGTWRMPTDTDNQELVDKCKWTWTTKNGHKGYLVTGPNGNSIFLPAAGWRYGTDSSSVGEIGYYWSSSLSSSYSLNARYLYFDSGGRSTNDGNRRNGRSVRPVTE